MAAETDGFDGAGPGTLGSDSDMTILHLFETMATSIISGRIPMIGLRECRSNEQCSRHGTQEQQRATEKRDRLRWRADAHQPIRAE